MYKIVIKRQGADEFCKVYINGVKIECLDGLYLDRKDLKQMTQLIADANAGLRLRQAVKELK